MPTRILAPDVDVAKRFLSTLGEPPWTFQVFNDKDKSKGRPWYRTGLFEEYAWTLTAKNTAGYGIFVCVNRCDGKGRRKENVDQVRALFLDLDGVPLEKTLSCPLKPHIVVETSAGHWHVYWLVRDFPLDKFDALLDAMVKRFGTCNGAKGINRVFRLPGFYHRKRDPYLVRLLETHRHCPFTYDEMVAEFLPNKASLRSNSALPCKPLAAIGFPGGDDQLLEAARRSGNGVAFCTLFDAGDTSAFGDDDSAADYALCTKLSFWCGPDAPRIDRLFRRSALMRSKWDEARATSTYGDLTIAKVLTKSHRFFTPPRPLPDFCEDTVPPHDSLEDLGRSVDDLLNDPKAGSSRNKKRRISRAICKWMQKRGRLLLDTSVSETEPYLVDEAGAVLTIADSLPVRSMLALTSLNATEPMYKWILSDLAVAAKRFGRCIALRRYSHWTDDALYLSSGPSQLVRATASTLELLPNGTDDVWFAHDTSYPAWKPAEPVSPTTLRLLRPILAAPPEVSSYSEFMQSHIFVAWIIAAITGVRPLPILLLLGHMGCGKSSTARGAVLIARGIDADVQTLPDTLRDAQVVLATTPFTCFDNLDTEPEPWLPDLLAATVTGGNIEFRKLYSNADKFTRPLTAAVCITSRTPQFAARADIQERVLPIFFGERKDEERADDRLLVHELTRHRSGVLTWIAQQAVTILSQSQEVSARGRFQSFARLVETLDPLRGDESLRLAYKAARVAVADLHPLIAAILEHGKPMSGTTMDILHTLVGAGYTFEHLGGSKRIANVLREHRQLIRLTEDKPTNKGVTFRIAGDEAVVNVVKVANSSQPFA